MAIVKSCYKLESGLRLGPEAIRACCYSVIVSPSYYEAENVPLDISKEQLVSKRRELFDMLNDDISDISCKKCDMVVYKDESAVSFDKLGFIDLAHYSYCNLRCNYCGFTRESGFKKPAYDALKILRLFESSDVEFGSCVDFNGGEPTLLPDLIEYLSFFRDNKIRVRLYSNGVKYSQAVYDALIDGTIMWLIVSLDAGSGETFKQMKGVDAYEKVVDNLRKYSEAGLQKGGRLSVKYVFTKNNISEVDVNGFVETMLMVRPQQVMMTYDFNSLVDLYAGKEVDFKAEYAPMVAAYVDMYVKFVRSGVIPQHLYEGFLTDAISEASEIMDKTKRDIEVALRDVAVCVDEDAKSTMNSYDYKSLVDMIGANSGGVVLAPAGYESEHLLRLLGDNSQKISVIGDLSKAKQGREVFGAKVVPYYELSEYSFDLVIITSQYHHLSILEDIKKTVSVESKKVVYLINQ